MTSGFVRVPAALTITAVVSTLLVESCARATGQQLPPRMIAGTHVACRDHPDTSSRVLHSYSVGDIVTVRETSRGADGATWHRITVSGPSPLAREQSQCWIRNDMTVEFSETSEEAVLLRVVDRTILRQDATFEDQIAVDKLLTDRFAGTLAASARLQLKRLLLIGRAVECPASSENAAVRDPVMRAWLRSLQDTVFYFEPDGCWYVRQEAYWKLFDAQHASPSAEDIALTAARAVIPSDECYEACVLRKIAHTWAKYWRYYPKGSGVAEGVAAAEPPVEYAVAFHCSNGEAADASQLAREVRASLSAVDVPGKSHLVAQLETIEQDCVEALRRPVAPARGN